jgi:hypothetical protein
MTRSLNLLSLLTGEPSSSSHPALQEPCLHKLGENKLWIAVQLPNISLESHSDCDPNAITVVVELRDGHHPLELLRASVPRCRRCHLRYYRGRDGISQSRSLEHVVKSQRSVLLGATLLGVRGRVQKEGGVVHVVADQLYDHSPLLGSLSTQARDFH